MLKTGITWTQLPTSLVGCSGVTCWRRLRDWTEAGVWPALHELLLTQLCALDALDLDRCAVDGSHMRALKGGDAVGPSPVDRGRPGSKHHLICDAGGIPLAVSVTGGNRNNVTQLVHWSTPSHRSGADADGLAGDRGSCSPTAVTTTTSTAVNCALPGIPTRGGKLPATP